MEWNTARKIAKENGWEYWNYYVEGGFLVVYGNHNVFNKVRVKLSYI